MYYNFIYILNQSMLVNETLEIMLVDGCGSVLWKLRNEEIIILIDVVFDVQ